MTTLAHLPRGAQATVTGLLHGHVLAKRLVALGLNPGAEVCVLENRGRGPLIVEVRGGRIALGRGQAARVAVDVAETSPSATELVSAAPCTADVAAED